ncbi:tetraspanin-13-like isoform X2 [Oculina patagonica]
MLVVFSHVTDHRAKQATIDFLCSFQMYSPKYSKAQSCAYFCSKNVLVALNTLYIFIALVLISVTVYAKVSAKITSLPILGGVIACGVFLLLIAIMGVVGAIRHSQVILFFYMIIMALLFIVQMSVSIGAVAVSHEQQSKLMEAGWKRMSPDMKSDIQILKDCCGFKNQTLTPSDDHMGHPNCDDLKCCTNKAPKCLSCDTCYDKLENVVNHLLKVAGGIGLFFSFTLLLGVCLTKRVRNRQQKPYLD